MWIGDLREEIERIVTIHAAYGQFLDHQVGKTVVERREVTEW